MALQCGIVGLPNVGKSTLFNALTQSKIEASNYPFCTIDPNVGVVPIPDKRLHTLEVLANPQRVIPAAIEFVDIAGLVKGASQGEGLGNQFLSNIRQTEAIIHVVRCFSDDNIIHVAGQVSPIDDVEIVNLELIYSDLTIVDRALNKVKKMIRSGNKDELEKQSILVQAKEVLENGIWLSTVDWGESMKYLREYQFITLKPVMYVANVSEVVGDEVAMVKKLDALAKKNNSKVVAVSVQIESEMVDMKEEEKLEFLKDLGWEEPGLNRIIQSAFDLLGLSTYFTVGEKEVRSWVIPKLCSAPKAARQIHTDFEQGFIRAEVIGYEDFVSCGSEAKARAVGKLRVEGREYAVQEGDVIHFLFNN